MSNSLRNVVIAELSKLRTLPTVPVTIAVTVLGTVGLAVVLAASTLEQPGGLPPHFGTSFALGTALHAVGYGQTGLILLGILTAASEYSGGQIRTTLTSVPSRTLLMAGKTIAYLTAAALTALLAVATSSVAAQVTLGEHGLPVSELFAAKNVWALLGAATYLVLIGLLAYALAILTRNLVVALVTMLTLVFVVSPFLTTITTLAEYLPDQAGSQIYQPISVATEVFTPVQGVTIMSAWIVLTLATAVVAFTKRDA